MGSLLPARLRGSGMLKTRSSDPRPMLPTASMPVRAAFRIQHPVRASSPRPCSHAIVTAASGGLADDNSCAGCQRISCRLHAPDVNVVWQAGKGLARRGFVQACHDRRCWLLLPVAGVLLLGLLSFSGSWHCQRFDKVCSYDRRRAQHVCYCV